MPTRDIKESCRTSRTLAKVSAHAERLFWRLTTYADDFGRMPADADVVRAACFAVMLDTVREGQVALWLDELAAVDLIRFYSGDDGKRYAFFPTWSKHQRTRAKHSKYPVPADAGICQRMPADAAVVTEEPGVPEDTETTVSLVRQKTPDVAREVLAWLNQKSGKAFRTSEVNLGFIRARLRDGIQDYQLKAIVSRKVREWGGTDRATYLRPETLFNKTKCEQYLGELPPASDNGHAG